MSDQDFGNIDTLEDSPSGINALVEDYVDNNIRGLDHRIQSLNMEIEENFTESNKRFEKIEKDIDEIKKSLGEVVSFMNLMLPTFLAGNLSSNVKTELATDSHQHNIDAERMISMGAEATVTPIRQFEQHNFRHVFQQENPGNISTSLSEEKTPRVRSSYFQKRLSSLGSTRPINLNQQVVRSIANVDARNSGIKLTFLSCSHLYSWIDDMTKLQRHHKHEDFGRYFFTDQRS